MSSLHSSEPTPEQYEKDLIDHGTDPKFAKLLTQRLFESIARERQKAVDELENGVKYYFISYAHPKGFGSIYFYAESFLDIGAARDEIKAIDNFSSVVIIAINPISKRQYDAATNSNKGEVR